MQWNALLLQQTHATRLLQLLITGYFSNLTSVLVVYNSSETSSLQLEYLHAVEEMMKQQQQLEKHPPEDQHQPVIFTALQWLNVATLNDTEFEEKILSAVDVVVTEGFITILSNTSRFLHARYYATRNAALRLKDKFYLFLCEDENPKDFLQLEILQFYPHHLMVTPSRTSMNVTAAERRGRNPPPMSTSTITTKTIGLDNEFASVIGAPTSHRDVAFEMWTQKFVGGDGSLDAVHLNSFEPSGTFASNVELYPDKLLNQQGRTLRLGSITYIPYVVTNYVAAGDGNVDPVNSHGPNRSVFYDGSEAKLVQTFCQVYNCHLRVEPYGVDNWGIIYENGSSSGMLGDIFNQDVELAIGCIYNWYNNITETSHVIARSAVTILGPAPALFPAWRTNLMPFTPDLWALLAVTMVGCALLLHAIKFSLFIAKTQLVVGREQRGFQHYNSFEQALLDVFAIFMQQSTSEKILRGFAGRFFMTTLLMATITLENTYSGQLKSILTIPFYTEPVDTMQKWSQTSWKWGAPSIIWVQTVEKSDLLMEQILTEKFEIRDYEYLKNASFRNDYGLAIERLMSGTYSFGTYVTAPALKAKIIPKDDLYFDWTRAVSIRGWPLMPLFDRHVDACMETGLFVHWERKMVWQYIDRQVQQILLALASGYTAKSPLQKLTLENVSGAMFALLCGYLLSFAALLLELFGHLVKKKFLHSE